ncbi:MAG: hypothetical protein RSC38_08620 [Oscillospiraceae bacterium]
MNKNKKGTTLVETVCGLAIISIAMIFGVEIFALAANGYMRGARQVLNAETVGRYIETGEKSDSIIVLSKPATAVFTFNNGKKVDFKNPMLATIEINPTADTIGNAPVSFQILMGSIAGTP